VETGRLLIPLAVLVMLARVSAAEPDLAWIDRDALDAGDIVVDAERGGAAGRVDVRADGTSLMDTVHLVAGTVPPQPTIPINVHADRTTELTEVYAWTGSNTSLHCSSFTSTSGFGQRGRANRPDWWFSNNGSYANCASSLRLYCFRRL
jgi:hypothetical protein